MIARLASFLIAIALVAACGKEGPSEPVSGRRGAVVTLKSNNVLVFAGQRVSLRNLVWRVTDSTGRELTDYELSAQLPSGWTIRNDTVIAPAQETVARIKVTATYVPILAANQLAAPLFEEAPLDTTDTATVTAAVDLKGRQWRVSYFCADTGRIKRGHDDLRKIDSVRVENATVDSVVYASDEGWIPQYGGVAQIWYSGTVVRWLEDGDSVHVSFVEHHQVHRQAPDTIVTTAGINDHRPMRRVSPVQQLLRYEGATWCDDEWAHTRGPVTMQEVAP